MSFKLRILGGFGLLLLLCMVQVGYLLWTTSRVGAGIEAVFNGPFAQVDAARAAKLEFDEAQKLTSTVLAMTAPVDSAETLRAFAAKAGRLMDHLTTLQQAGGERGAGQLGAIAGRVNTWLANSRVLLGERAVEAVPAPYVMERLEREITASLDMLVRETVEGAQIMRSSMVASVAGSQRLALVLSLVSLIGGAGAAVLLSRSITAPIKSIETVLSELASGNLAVAIPHVERSDEIGAMARAVDVLKGSGIDRARLEQEAKTREAGSAAEKRRLMAELAQSFESEVGGLVQSVAAAASEMESAAQAMSSTAEESHQQSGVVADRATEMSTNVQAVAAATEELPASASEIGVQINHSTLISAKALEDAKRTNETVQALAAGAQKIGDVVALIKTIAGQTNLLALNATIEAARAGEAGLALRLSPAKSRRSPRKPLRPRRKSPATSCISRRRPTTRYVPFAGSAPPLRRFIRSRRRSRPRPTNSRLRPRRSRAQWRRRPAGPKTLRKASPSSAVPPRTLERRRKRCSARQGACRRIQPTSAERFSIFWQGSRPPEANALVSNALGVSCEAATAR